MEFLVALGNDVDIVVRKRARRRGPGRLQVLSTPMVEMPARERWLWDNKDAMGMVQRGHAQSARGKIKALRLATLAADDD